MARAQVIEFYGTHIQRVVSDLTDKYQYRPERKWRFLQRACFWVLRKIGAYAIDERDLVTRFRIDTREFMRNLYTQRKDLLENYNLRGERLLIGGQDFSELMGSTEIRQLVSFTGEYCVNGSIMGMKVTIVPWMSGMLVMPREIGDARA